jgi:hypothetical protein
VGWVRWTNISRHKGWQRPESSLVSFGHSFGATESDSLGIGECRMRRARLALILAFAAVLSGCAGREQTAARQGVDQYALDAQDDEACRIAGAAQGSQQYSECRTRLGQQRAAATTNAQESKQRDIDARMQAGIPPASSRP